MTDTTTADTTTTTTGTTTTATPVAQNYILYRTKAFMRQGGYTYLEGETPVIPAPVVSGAVGTVVQTQLLTSLDGITVADGFAYALDADGKYPVGSIYTPPADTTTTTTTTTTAGTTTAS